MAILGTSVARASSFALPSKEFLTLVRQGTNSATISAVSGGSLTQYLGVGVSAVAIGVQGTWTDTAPTISVSADGTNYISSSSMPVVNILTGDTSGITSGAQGIWVTTVVGQSVKITFPSGGTGNAVVTIIAGPGSSPVAQGSGSATSAGQATANSTLSTISTNQTTLGSQTTKINDGTNTASMIAGDITALATGSVYKTYNLTLSGVQSSGTYLTYNGGASTDIPLNGFTAVSVSSISLGSGVTALNYQTSGTTSGYITSSMSSTAATTASTSTSLVATANYAQSITAPHMVIATVGAQTTGQTTSCTVTVRMGSIAPVSNFSSVQAQPFVSISGGGTTYIGAVSSGYNGWVGGALTSIKGSQGTLYHVHLTNNTASTIYVGFFNATSITYGTTVPIVWYEITANATIDAAPPVGSAFTNDIYYQQQIQRMKAGYDFSSRGR